MTALIPNDVITRYPVFKANQVLTESDLNSVVDYLDQQDRFTRVCLLGTGIVCGFELSSKFVGENKELAELTVSLGIGVTSLGHLVHQEKTMVFTHCGEIQDDVKEGLGEFNPDLSLNANDQDNLLELIEANDSRVLNLDPTVIHLANKVPSDKKFEYVVILCVIVAEPENQHCGTDCNETGTQRSFTYKYLLAKTEWLKAHLKKNENFGTGSLDEIFRTDFHLGDLKLHRFGSDGSVMESLASITDYATLTKFYNRILKIGRNEITTVLKEAHNAFTSVFTRNPPDALNVNLNKYFEFKSENKEEIPPPGFELQYVYAYYKDLVATYQEFVSIVLDIMEECDTSTVCTEDEECSFIEVKAKQFPLHLLLGPIGGTEILNPPSYQRTPYFQPPVYNGNTNRIKSARFLFERLRVLLDVATFKVPNAGVDNEIKITPSQNRTHTLGQQAIPYYYTLESKVHTYWNHFLSRRGKQDQVPWYTRANNELLHTLDNTDFFRIEGHIGQDHMVVFDAIKEIRNRNNLPFDIVAVRLGEFTAGEILARRYLFEDLELTYAELRFELACLLEQVEDPKNGIVPLDGIDDLVADIRLIVDAEKDLSHFVFPSKIKQVTLESAEYSKITYKSGSFGLRVRLPGTYTDLSGLPLPPVLESKTVFESDPSIDDFGEAVDGITKRISENIYRIEYSLTGDISSGNFSLESVKINLLTVEDGEEVVQFDMPNDELLFKFINLFDANKLPDDFETKFQLLIDLIDVLKEQGQTSILTVKHRLVLERFRLLYKAYKKRRDEVESLDLFHRFAEKNPGLEHKGGVPQGGTFVLVYTEKGQEILGDFRNNSVREKSFFAEENLNKRDTIVVADFCLPYMCCSDRPPVSFIVDKPDPVFILPDTEYCANDAEQYEFYLYPLGGQLSIEGDTSHPALHYEGGRHYFIPDEVHASYDDKLEDSTITITYACGEDETSIEVTLLGIPDARFSIVEEGGARKNIDALPGELCIGKSNLFKLVPNNPLGTFCLITETGADYQLEAEPNKKLNNELNLLEAFENLNEPALYGIPLILEYRVGDDNLPCGPSIMRLGNPVTFLQVPPAGFDIGANNKTVFCSIDSAELLMPLEGKDATDRVHEFSGPGVVDGRSFDPSKVELGTNAFADIEITHKVTATPQADAQSNDCFDSIKTPVRIYGEPNTSFIVEGSTITGYCKEDENTYNLVPEFEDPEGVELKHEFTIDGNETAILDPSSIDLGDAEVRKIELVHTVTVIHGDIELTCGTPETMSVWIYAKPKAGLTIGGGTNTRFCSTDSTAYPLAPANPEPDGVILSHSFKVGEIESDTLIPENIVLDDKNVANVDLTHIVTVKHDGALIAACSNETQVPIEIFAVPSAEFTGVTNQERICNDADPIALTPVRKDSDVQHAFSGNGVKTELDSLTPYTFNPKDIILTDKDPQKTITITNNASIVDLDSCPSESFTIEVIVFIPDASFKVGEDDSSLQTINTGTGQPRLYLTPNSPGLKSNFTALFKGDSPDEEDDVDLTGQVIGKDQKGNYFDPASLAKFGEKGTIQVEIEHTLTSNGGCITKEVALVNVEKVAQGSDQIFLVEEKEDTTPDESAIDEESISLDNDTVVHAEGPTTDEDTFIVDPDIEIEAVSKTIESDENTLNLINARGLGYREQMNQLADEGGTLKSTKGFTLANMFLIQGIDLPAEDAIKRYKEATSVAVKAFRLAKKVKRKRELSQVVAIITSRLFDKAMITEFSSPEQQLVKDTLAKMQDSGIDTPLITETWNSDELRPGIEGAKIEAFQGLLP